MKNVEFLVVSLVLIWVLLAGYLGFLNLKLNRMAQAIDDIKDDQQED